MSSMRGIKGSGWPILLAVGLLALFQVSCSSGGSQVSTIAPVAPGQQRFHAPILIGLPANGKELVTINPETPAATRSLPVSGLLGRLVAIDVRPADGELYGLTDRDRIYRIFRDSGHAVEVSNLGTRLFGLLETGFDFNPVADRARYVSGAKVVSLSQQVTRENARINVDTGALTIDTPLFFADAVLTRVEPTITAVAYTNNFAGASTTDLYAIDTNLDRLFLLQPPNSGRLLEVGELGVDMGTLVGFDIFTTPAGDNIAFALSQRTLYTIDLGTGAARVIGTVSGGPYVGLAAFSL